MNKKAPLCLGFSLVILSLLIIPAARAQSAFSNAVMNLNPVAYWPLQETVQPPAADVETNIGSLGAAANAYYSGTNVTHGTAPIPGDGADFSVACSATFPGSFLAVPTTTGAETLPAGPFSVEIWVNPTNVTASQTIIAQTGVAGSGGLGGSANSAGWSLNIAYIPSLNVANANTVTFHVYNGVGSSGGAEASYAASTFTVGSWYHIVGVFDGTNAHVFVNDVSGSSSQAINGTQALDTWDELTIGCGRGLNNNKFGGNIDEVAIYTNALSSTQIANHYNAGAFGDAPYESTILGDNPYMYWRMDAPTHTTPSFTAYPTAFNYGTGVGINGLYLAGTTPGVAGPNLPGFGSPSFACAMNGIGTDDTNAIPSFTNGVPYATNTLAQTGIIITNLLSSMNLTTNSKSFMAWFKQNPSDQHRGVLVGHSDNGWRTSMDPNHVTANTSGKDNADISSSPLVYNDGNWHFAVIVYTNTGLAKGAGYLATNFVYVDGLLVANSLNTNPAAPGTLTNVTIGEAPDKSSGNGSNYTAQVLAGSIAHVAYFTNALTSDQVVNLYTNATGGTMSGPIITGQPITGRTAGAGGTNGSGPGSFIFFGVNYAGATSLQWYYNSSSNYAGGTNLANDNVKYFAANTVGSINPNSAQMTITNLADTDSGYYYVVLNNAFGSTTSILASLTIHTEPFFSSQTPAGGTLQLYQNQSSTLSVTPGGTNFTFLWYSNGVATTVTSTSFSVTNVQTSMSGNTYFCVASNSSGTATSATVTLSVLPLPAAITGSSYASSILALNPTAYFPMHETGPEAVADIETNYGTLGPVADGTYADWNVNNGFPDDTTVLHNIIGALANDPDPAELFAFHGNTNSYFLVPHTSPQTTITLPFTIEAWVKGANGTFGDIVSQDGTKLNTSNDNNVYGLRLSYGGNIQVLLGNGSGASIIAPPTLSFFQWHHVVLTGDTNGGTTNITLYVDGSETGSVTTPYFLPDSWDPLTIGAGLWNAAGVQRIASDIAIDEVAIYNTNLDAGTVSTHYNDGISGAAGQYFTAVSSLHPLMYYRMNRSAYNLPPTSTWPVMTNYGIAGGNGVYTPGLAPGSVVGPNNGAGSFVHNLSGTNAAPMNGMSTFASALNPGAFNVLGKTTPLSFSLWFRGNPTDARYQALISQGPGWQAAVQVNGTLQFFLGNGFVNSSNVVNDGNWHQAVVTYSNFVGAVYVDGMLNSTTVSNVSLTNPAPAVNTSMCIGADPRFTTPNNETGAGRQFAGDICEVAFWNGTVLTSNQVVSLYNSSGAAPMIAQQPVSAGVNGNTSFTNSILVVGSAPLSYQWYKNNLPLPTGGQTNLTIGATNASLVISPVKTNDASANYFVVITNSFGAITSSVVSLTVFADPIFTNEPVLITQTNNILLFAGATPTFKVGVLGAVPLYYQWFTNGVAATLQATNLSSYVFSTLSGATNFYCVVSNSFNIATNTPVSVTVINDPTAPYPVSVLAANPLGYWRLNETTNSAGSSSDVSGVLADDYWGAFNGFYTNADLAQPGYSSSTDPSETAVQFGIDSLVDGDVFGIGGIDFSAPATNSVAFSVEAWVNGFSQTKDAGLVSKGFGGGGEQFDLDTGSDGAPTVHGFRFFVRDASGATHGASGKVMPNGSWHHLVGVCDEVNSNVTLYVDGVVAASTSISPGSGILSSSRQMLIGARPSSSAATSNDFQFVGTIDDVAVYNYALSANEIAAQYSSAGVPPNLSQAPATNVTANGFGTLTLAAAAVGTPSIGYTWTDVGSNAIIASGSSNEVPLNATLNISNVPPAWNGDTLELTVTNFYGTTNYLITLTVFTNAPIFTTDVPAQVEVVSGKSYNYSVAVVGAQPFFFQWYNGATLLLNQTNPSLSIVAGSPGSTTYFVVATNAFGATTSTISTFTSIVQLSGYAYATNVLSLNPVGYWPLQETTTPAPATIETNYGLLGKPGNAYYAVTNANPPAVAFNQPGALTGSGDNDPSVFFSGYSPTGPAGATNEQSYAFVPRTMPALTIMPPFSAECWVLAQGTGTEFADMFGEGGGTGLNAANGGGNFGGFRMAYGGNNGGGPNFQFYIANGNGTTRNSVSTVANSLPVGSWHHCVATYDGTTVTLYVDGVPQLTNSTTLAGANTENPDTWSPLTLGGSFWQNTGLGRGIYASVDEVAVYTNILNAAQVLNHYQIATGATAGNYMQTIRNDQPLLYYRMDCPGFTNPPVSILPEAVNYGSAAPNGAYLSGVPPGAVAGPTNNTLGANTVAAPINGIISCVDAGSDPSFNPSGTQSFTAMTWFKTYPSDDRLESVMSHGGTNWAMNIDGTTGHLIWNLFSSGSQLTSSGVLNDGNWHFVAGVYNGTTSSLYVDGQLDSSITITHAVAAEPSAHLYLGGNSDLTIVGNNQAYFGGALAQAAFFTNAVTAAQIQALFAGTAILPVNPSTNATIIRVSLSGTNLVVQGTNNNTPNTSYHYAVLLSTNVATPLSNWTIIVTNPFNPDGTFDYTNPVIPGTPQQFIDVKAVP